MGKQNRVTPNGDLIKTLVRGSLMGNRGILHDADGTLTKKRWSHPNWVYCLPDYRGRKQPINAPGHYTQLFFLDEVTALAAGHRPCGCCQHQRLVEFLDFWAKGNPEHASVVSIKSIDKILHRDRVTPSREKVTFRSKLGNLPDGVMVMFPQVKGIYYLFTEGQLKMWSPCVFRRKWASGSDLSWATDSGAKWATCRSEATLESFCKSTVSFGQG